jgi:hypothetical protein
MIVVVKPGEIFLTREEGRPARPRRMSKRITCARMFFRLVPIIVPQMISVSPTLRAPIKNRMNTIPIARAKK